MQIAQANRHGPAGACWSAPRNKQVDDGIWIVSFMSYDLRYIDLDSVIAGVTRSARNCHPCLRYNLLPMCPGRTHGIWCRKREPFYRRSISVLFCHGLPREDISCL